MINPVFLIFKTVERTAVAGQGWTFTSVALRLVSTKEIQKANAGKFPAIEARPRLPKASKESEISSEIVGN